MFEAGMGMTFFVPGRAQPGGSKRAFVVKGRAIVTDDNCRSRQWREAVAWAAIEAGAKPMAGPLSVRFEFFLQRPSSHYGTGRNVGIVRSSAPTYPAVRPDASKLIRSTEDALTGIAWKDDAQIVDQMALKRYAEREQILGVQITIEEKG